jgi:RNA polymerase sigma factor (sigma-70 family)
MGLTGDGIGGARDFPSTMWSAICHARDASSPDYARNLSLLVEAYWRPVYVVIRYSYGRTHDEAKDLTQDFFATVVLGGALLTSFAPERGSFRKLLRAAITNFMRNAERDAGRLKRGGDLTFVSFEEGDLGNDPSAQDAESPEACFDQSFRRVVMAQVLAQVRVRLLEQGRAEALDIFTRHDLAEQDRAPSYRELGDALGLSVDQVKHALRQARDVFLMSVTHVVRGYVDGPDELASEVRALLAVR